MRRREFIPLLGGAALAWPIEARAQQAVMPVIGFLRSTSIEDLPGIVPAFRQGLRESGYVEGQNVVIEFRSAEGHTDRLPELVADLIRRPVNVIIGNLAAALAAKAATTTVPIVFASGGDPIRDGLVTSLSRPGNNITGVSFLNSTLGAKQLELLRDLVPTATVVALLVDTSNPAGMSAVTDVQAAASALGIRIIVANASSEHDIDVAFASIVQQQVGGVLSSGAAFFTSRRHQIVALAARHALPVISISREYVAAGGLISYGGSVTDAYRQVGVYAGRILSGAYAGDLPVVQSTRVELAINLGTARALGLTIPPNLLVRADEVIE